jgi:hypothetical protein
VEPPEASELRGVPNVATRAKRIVFALIGLGETLADLASLVTGRQVSSQDVAGLERSSVNYYGWWNAAHVEPITRHLPLSLGRDQFLDRMTDLTKFVIEGINESVVRNVVLSLGYSSEETREWRSMKLLERVVRHCRVGTETGLDVVRDAPAIVARTASEVGAEGTSALKSLNALRQLDAHRGGASSQTRLNAELAVFGIDLASTAGGWGEAADRVYDGVAEALEELEQMIHQTLMK